jgi:GNAT superfamily N-acetyltransferase
MLRRSNTARPLDRRTVCMVRFSDWGTPEMSVLNVVRPAAAIAVRDLAAADRAGWEPLWRGYLEFYNATVADDVTDLTFRRLLDSAEDMFCLVAEQDGALVGVVQCVLHRSTWTTAPYCYLQDLFVSPDARDQGVGRKLIEAVYARADALGAARVYWLTHETNATARVLYDAMAVRSGFIQYRRG